MPDEARPQIDIRADFSECINYASWQNSAPLLRSLEVHNPTDDSLADLVLEFDASPSFCRPKQWHIQRIGAGSHIALRDLDLQVDPEYLNGLNEAEKGIATLQLRQGERPVAQSLHELRMLARDEWGGMRADGEMLCAFAMPNDPAIARLLKNAARILERNRHSSALDGYQSSDPQRAYLLVSALWSAVSSESITYCNPPSSFENVGQKVRRPANILSDGLATCLDLTLLFVSAIEAMGLNAVIVMTQGHCFAGAWLLDKTLNRLIEPDCSEIRKALVSNELLTFETTLVTHNPSVEFKEAISTAREATKEAREDEFLGGIDVKRARRAQIRPLASHNASYSAETTTKSHAPLPLAPAPEIRMLPPEIALEKPTTSQGRIDRWQRKLLDLSMRNRLLNFRETKQTLPLVCPDISLLEDLLAGGSKLRIISLPEESAVGERDPELHRQRTKQSLETEFARQSLDRNEIACPLTTSEITNRLTNIYRNVRNDLAEGGTNTLFLAVGFLKWKQKPEDEKSYRAPLLLLPVSLTRKSALSPYQLSHHEDELRFNATLIQLMKKDFDRDFGRFESNLPTDDSGVDVPLILEWLRAEVRDMPGFEVIEETALGTFSFAKYLMWKDLVDRVDQLEQNRVVRHLIHDPDKAFESQSSTTIPDPEEIDSRYEPKDLIHPLPADSSQLAAVMAASEGHDFVLVGPPGTGKSQTIANVISQCLATGKTILFVAEKTAALDVVFRRLREHGLGDCCVELHSNKADRRRFLDQLQSAWENNRRSKQNQWLEISERLRVRRDELNSYVNAIHKEYPNGWTAYHAMGICVRESEVNAPDLKWPVAIAHDSAAYQTLESRIRSLASAFGAVDPAKSLPMIANPEWSVAWETNLLSRCAEIADSASRFQRTLSSFWNAIGLPEKTDCSLEELARLKSLACALIESAELDASILFNKQFAKFPGAIKELDAAIDAYRTAKGQMLASYDDSLESIPVTEIEQQWRQAVASMWPFSWFAKRRVNRLLQTYASSGVASVERDLQAIRTMQSQRETIRNTTLAEYVATSSIDDINTDSLRETIANAKDLRTAMIDVGRPLDATNAVSKALHATICSRSPNSPAVAIAREFLTQADEFISLHQLISELSGQPWIDERSHEIVADSVRLANAVQSYRTKIQSWTAWCAAKQQANSEKLDQFVAVLETGAVSPGELLDRFRLAYARWWIVGVIDSNEVLRQFQKFKQEDAIADFRKLDELARQLATSRVKQTLAHGLPTVDSVARRSELGLLRHQMQLKRPSKTIRELISGMPEYFGQLAPCLLMSPLSIAQYLPAGHALFDVVIFDEASQITTWDAIGAIARGKQTIIVGDPKQLPPTNFFGRTEDDDANEELDDHEKDLESILDEAKASGIPTLMLNWHYRSRHESLIAFSNWNYYGNKLVTFPAAEMENRGVTFFHVSNGAYDRGKSRTNRIEAQAIVDAAVERMQQDIARPPEERITFGVITFNSQQQSLIQDMFDDAQRKSPELEWYFSDERIEPTVVKNLENVQGDERDVMYFSITFGRDGSGREISRNFGALNRDGGERRLNVAVTRARQELVVYSSFKADQLRSEGINARGVIDLKNFLEYAEKGPEAIIRRNEGSVGEFESPFEEAVAAQLSAKGWQVVPQVGISGFRIDMGIVDPRKPGAFLAGIECDGETYHRSAAARDRDKTRQMVLENLGWTILRVWSRDWWYDSQTAVDVLDKALNELLDVEQEETEEASPRVVFSAASEPEPQIARAIPQSMIPECETAVVESDLDVATSPHGIFRRTVLANCTSEQQHFYDTRYDDDIRAMAMTILNNEAPIREDILAQRIARAHGFGRTGGTIRSRILDLLSDIVTTEESTGRFLWLSEPSEIISFRYPATNDDQRSIDEVALAELCGVILDNSHLLNDADPAVAIARLLGVGRLFRSTRERIEEAIARCRNRS